MTSSMARSVSTTRDQTMRYQYISLLVLLLTIVRSTAMGAPFDRRQSHVARMEPARGQEFVVPKDAVDDTRSDRRVTLQQKKSEKASNGVVSILTGPFTMRRCLVLAASLLPLPMAKRRDKTKVHVRKTERLNKRIIYWNHLTVNEKSKFVLFGTITLGIQVFRIYAIVRCATSLYDDGCIKRDMGIILSLCVFWNSYDGYRRAKSVRREVERNVAKALASNKLNETVKPPRRNLKTYFKGTGQAVRLLCDLLVLLYPLCVVEALLWIMQFGHFGSVWHTTIPFDRSAVLFYEDSLATRFRYNDAWNLIVEQGDILPMLGLVVLYLVSNLGVALEPFYRFLFETIEINRQIMENHEVSKASEIKKQLAHTGKFLTLLSELSE